jgi:hypothetical protein
MAKIDVIYNPSNNAWTLAAIDMKTHAVQTATLPWPYEYHLAATSSNIVAVGSTGAGPGSQPGVVAVYDATGQLVKQWSFPDTYGENEVSISTSGQTTFVMAKLLDSPATSQTQQVNNVIYQIQGTSINTYTISLPLDVNNVAAVSSTSILAYGANPYANSEIDYITLANGAATVGWNTSGTVAGPIVVSGSQAYVSGVDVPPTMMVPKGLVDPAWILNLSDGSTVGTVQDSGYGVYPLVAGSYGFLAEVHQANSPNVPVLAVFSLTGALETTEPPNPNELNTGTGTIVIL